MKNLTAVTVCIIFIAVIVIWFSVLYDTEGFYGTGVQNTHPCQDIGMEYMELFKIVIDFDMKNASIVEIDEFSKTTGKSVLKELAMLEERGAQNNCLDTSSEWYTPEFKEKLEYFADHKIGS